MKKILNQSRALIIAHKVRAKENRAIQVKTFTMSTKSKDKPSPSTPSKTTTGGKRKLKAEERDSKKHKASEHATENMPTTSKSKGENCVKRDRFGKLVFEDYPEFRPNMTPKEVMQAGSFGGTYFRPIFSKVTGQKYSDVWKEFPSDWFEGLNIKKQVISSTYHTEVNTYKAKCGGSLEMWESSGWIKKQDPYGWFQWYCRFYLGRRTEDDKRQVDRWSKCAGEKGRWKNNLVTKIVRSGCSYENRNVSPVVRQVLQHWGYRLTKEDFEKQAKIVRQRLASKSK